MDDVPPQRAPLIKLINLFKGREKLQLRAWMMYHTSARPNNQTNQSSVERIKFYIINNSLIRIFLF